MRTVFFALAGLLLTMSVAQNVAQAAEVTDCAVKYTRTACPGQEATSYKKCDGNQSCVKYKKASTLEECQAAATKSCRNRRLNITKMKVINAEFQGQRIQTANGNADFCQEYEKRAEEFNQCGAN